MSCVCCFFDNEFQKLFKNQCLGANFQARLVQYKNWYLSAIDELNSISGCSCSFSAQYKTMPNFSKFTDDFLTDTLSKKDLIAQMFDCLISLISTCKSGNSAAATYQAKEYIQIYCTEYHSINDVQMCNLLFRGRENTTKSYDPADIMQFFHNPLSAKGSVSEQRFSSKGSIMFYLARSLPTALQELGKDISEVNLSLFVPKYSWVHSCGMYSFENSIDVSLNAAIPFLGSGIEYDNTTFTFAKRNSTKMLGESILFQILTFPTVDKLNLCDEYLLPHLFTRHFMRPPYLGVVYQSSKNTSAFSGLSKYAGLDYNYCFFVPESSSEYNMDLLDCFHTVCIGECVIGKTYSDVCEALTNMGDILKEKNMVYNMTDYIMVHQQIDQHLSYMKGIVSHGITYYESEEGILELALLYKLIEKIQQIADAPDKYEIMKWSGRV